MHYSPLIARSEDQTRLVKKAGIVHFQGIVSSPSKAEADKHPCCLWTEICLRYYYFKQPNCSLIDITRKAQ